jgi:hypothetical protein
MSMKTALAWKRFYEAERARLGEAGIAAMLERAPDVSLPARGALVFPHTMLAASGALVAAVARAVVRAGADEVLALGVLHGAREDDAELVKRARAGDADAVATLRRVHGEGAPGDDGRWSEEFSLDAFAELVALAARREGKRAPRIVARYPFLAGEEPASMSGFEQLARLSERMPIVATTDPIHHGAGYGTRERFALAHATTRAWARERIEEQLDFLASGEWAAFARLAADVRSDFRDTGPALASLLRARGGMKSEIVDMTLVDYASALDAQDPTWVAAALVRIARD